jgi:hypothetical protein
LSKMVLSVYRDGWIDRHLKFLSCLCQLSQGNPSDGTQDGRMGLKTAGAPGNPIVQNCHIGIFVCHWTTRGWGINVAVLFCTQVQSARSVVPFNL